MSRGYGFIPFLIKVLVYNICILINRKKPSEVVNGPSLPRAPPRAGDDLARPSSGPGGPHQFTYHCAYRAGGETKEICRKPTKVASTNKG